MPPLKINLAYSYRPTEPCGNPTSTTLKIKKVSSLPTNKIN